MAKTKTKTDDKPRSKHDNPCFKKAADDEPIFVLRATDNLAPDTVRAWASSARCRGVNLKKVKDALQVADEMEAWAKKHGGASEPD